MSELKDTIVEFLEVVTPLLDDEKINDEIKGKIESLSQKVLEEVEHTISIKPEHVVRTIETFEEMAKRTLDEVEFEMPGGKVVGIPIQSISKAEMSHIRRYSLENEPKAPKRREKVAGEPDLSDPGYDKQVSDYGIALEDHNNRIMFEYLKVGMKTQMPGKTEDEQFTAFLELPAGMAEIVSTKIRDISHLNEKRVTSFSMR